MTLSVAATSALLARARVADAQDAPAPTTDTTTATTPAPESTTATTPTAPIASPPPARAAAAPPATDEHEPAHRAWIDRRAENAWDRMEFTMGFIAGVRRYDHTAFATQSPPAIGGSLDAPFRSAPFDGVPVFGLRYDVRAVVSFLRLTAGFDLPFPSFDAQAATYSIGGSNHEVRVQSLTPYELRFGIGAEYPFGAVCPFVDLMGGVHWVHAGLLVDGAPAGYDATSFAFSVRGGIRLMVRRWFFGAIAGEVGLWGDVTWGSEVSVGFATP